MKNSAAPLLSAPVRLALGQPFLTHMLFGCSGEAILLSGNNGIFL